MIVGSLVAMIAVGLALMSLSGPVAFWICGLLLCLFIGPTQSSARTLMLRMSVDGKEGVAFGLYTTTGRAVSFLAPSLFSLFIDCFDSVRAGIGWIVGGARHRPGGHGGGACTAPDTGALAHRGTDRQAVAGVRLNLDTVDSHRAGDLAADIDDREARRMRLPGLGNSTSLRHGSTTLNSVCSTLPVSTYVMLIARPLPLTS